MFIASNPCKVRHVVWKEKSPSGFGQTLAEAMILLNSVVEGLHLPQFTAFKDDPFSFEFLPL